MKLKYKYIIGTHVMFFEIEMLHELVTSIINASEDVENKENITIDFLFNMSEYFEKIDKTEITEEELTDKFWLQMKRLERNGVNVNAKVYNDHTKPITMVDYRRDLNYFGCRDNDYVIWGESDCLLPREMFQALEQIKNYASAQGINRYITTFAVRKMWDDSWKPLEHVDMTDKPLHQRTFADGTKNPEAYNQPYSIRYTMSIDEMNEINNKVEDFDVRMINHPQFDGSGLVISSDLIKNGVNVPLCIMGHLVDDTSMMYSCKQIMGKNYVQFIVKNILKVHNRNHPKKRLYARDMTEDMKLSEVEDKGKGGWFHKMKELVHFNLGNFGPSQARFNTYTDFNKAIDIDKKEV